MPKRKKTLKKPAKKGSNALNIIAWILAVIAIVLVALIGGYYVGYEDARDEIVKKERKKQKKRLDMIQKLETTAHKKSDDSVNKRLKELLKKDVVKHEIKIEEKVEAKIENQKFEKHIDASHEYDIASLPKAPKREVKIISKKPKLAIIIDDVSVRSHVEAIKSLNIPLTMSFLPPSKYRPNSHTLAAKEEFYMVHLPMEAKNFTKEEPFTLRVSDSQKMVQKRVAKIKELFPSVKYINNHTGSKFTSDELAVNKLIYALDKQGIDFIDSRTIGTTKVPLVMKNYGKKYIARDIFLDHESDKEYVIEQIKKAIKISKAHGTAIAIGHPHENTLLAINESKKLFEDVELVLVNRLY
ncbi:divergent polysaccharide deacetylase family protein [Sulfurimonas sp.]|nr:divergent polysaccharide deacetylase family protein [Sulfurimonas sp.]